MHRVLAPGKTRLQPLTVEIELRDALAEEAADLHMPLSWYLRLLIERRDHREEIIKTVRAAVPEMRSIIVELTTTAPTAHGRSRTRYSTLEVTGAEYEGLLSGELTLRPATTRPSKALQVKPK